MINRVSASYAPVPTRPQPRVRFQSAPEVRVFSGSASELRSTLAAQRLKLRLSKTQPGPPILKKPEAKPVRLVAESDGQMAVYLACAVVSLAFIPLLGPFALILTGLALAGVAGRMSVPSKVRAVPVDRLTFDDVVNNSQIRRDTVLDISAFDIKKLPAYFPELQYVKYLIVSPELARTLGKRVGTITVLIRNNNEQTRNSIRNRRPSTH